MHYISTILLLLSGLSAIGQNAKKADKLYDRLGYQVAIDNYGDSEDLNLDQRIKLANSYRLIGQSKNAEVLYRNILKESQESILYYHFAQALLMNNKVDEAVSNFKIFKSKLSEDDDDVRADNYLRFIESNQFDEAKNILVENLKSINTDNFEFSPFIINDGLVFISSRPSEISNITASVNYVDFGESNGNKDDWTEKNFNKIFTSSKDNNRTFSNISLLSEKLSGKLHQGPLHINDDEDLLHFTSNHLVTGKYIANKKNVIPLDIYIAIKLDGEWSEAITFDRINTTEYNEAHPTISASGQVIIFSSDRPEGQGGMDLYISNRVDGEWTTPKNLGPAVNTPGNEVFPFINNNGQLYFSSDGLGGYGGLDMFQTGITKDGKIDRESFNVGYPLNSNQDDFGYHSEDDDKTGYFSSSRASAMGRDDIFYFKKGEEEEAEEEVTPPTPVEKPVMIVQPVIAEPEPLKEIIVELEPVVETKPTIIEPVSVKPIITTGMSFTLDKLYYDFDKATLRDESIPELNKLVDFLDQHNDVKIELSAHTDARGLGNYNLSLSQERAEAVVKYLVQNKVSKSRIIAVGYGEKRLRNNCTDGQDCTETEHQYNRRTEIKILDLGANVNLVYTDNGPSTIDERKVDQVRSFSEMSVKPRRIKSTYKNVDKLTVSEINNQLLSTGPFKISVGVYGDPSKKVRRIKALGFSKVEALPIEGKEHQKAVYIGALNNLSKAKIIRETLRAMGIKNSIVVNK